MGLREQKKQETVEALRAAALRLALDRGPENVRVDDIAAAAGVSPRTYNNYFSSREHAIVSAVTAERELRVAAAVAARPAQVSLSDAVIDAVIDQYADPGGLAADVLVMITNSPALRSSYADTVAMAGDALTKAIIERTDGMDRLTAQVLSASVGAAAKLALTDWLGGAPPDNGFVVPSGSLADRMRAALMPLAPALDARGSGQ
jgi:AcrR family transcriptional regulator